MNDDFSLEQCAIQLVKQEIANSDEPKILFSLNTEIQLEVNVGTSCEKAAKACKPGIERIGCGGSRYTITIKRNGDACEIEKKEEMLWDGEVACLTQPTETVKPTSTATTTPTPTQTATPTVTATHQPVATPTEKPKPLVGAPVVAYTLWNGKSLQIAFSNLAEEVTTKQEITRGKNPVYMPVWSPDGMKIAFLELNSEGNTNLYLVDFISGEVNQPSSQTIDPSGNFCWGADQENLFWGASQPDSSEMDIYQLEVATGKIVDLTLQSKVWDAFPSCSPVSDQIAFVYDRSGTGKELDNIWVMDSQGENLKQLTNAPTWENSYPAWSPDGSEIAFIRFSFMGDEKYGPAGLWAVKSDGSKERLIQELKDLKSYSSPQAPAWSPDGQLIAYLRGSNEETAIYIVTGSSGKPVWSSDLPGNNAEMSWSVDSEYLVFTNTQDKVSRIYLVSIAEGDVVPLLDVSDNFQGMFRPGSELTAEEFMRLLSSRTTFEGDGITLEIPKNWARVNPQGITAAGEMIIAVRPPTGKGFFKVSQWKASEQSMEAFAWGMDQTLEENAETKVIERVETTLAGEKAIRWLYTGNCPGYTDRTCKYFSVIAQKGDTCFLVSFLDDLDSYDQFQADLDKILASFRFD